MANVDWGYYIGIGICLVLGITTIATYATLLPKDSAQNTKLLTVISVFSFVTSITAYFLAVYYFSSNASHLIQFILAVVMLVILPGTLISASVSTVTISNLRDTLAASA
jgi:hypothetical protein